MGGFNGAIVPDTYSYDVDTGLWVKKASMTVPRGGHACSAFDGEIWVGGRTPNLGGETPVVTSEVYNVERDEWRTVIQLPFQAFYPGEFVSHGKLLLYVGRDLIYRLNEEKDGWIYVSNYLNYSTHA